MNFTGGPDHPHPLSKIRTELVWNDHSLYAASYLSGPVFVNDDCILVNYFLSALNPIVYDAIPSPVVIIRSGIS
jgi:hypothetical protein